MKFSIKKVAGFTMVEIMVVITVSAILSAIAYANFGQGRAVARDKVRMATVEQLTLAMRLYAEESGSVVDCEHGVKIAGTTDNSGNRLVMNGGTPGSGHCNDSAEILTFLENYFGTVPTDPLGVDHPTHYYYFDSNHNCGAGINKPLIFAVNLESSPSNAIEVCGDQSGTDGGYEGGVPYVQRLEFIVDYVP